MNYKETVNTFATQWCELVIEQERLINLANRPVCGKPGHGFKAARKAARAKREIDQHLATLDAQINNWTSRNGKADKQERAKRWENFQQAIRAWNPDTLLRHHLLGA